MVQARGIAVVRVAAPRRPQHIAEQAVVVLHMRLAVQREAVLAKPQGLQQHPVVEGFGTCQVADGDVDMVDADDVRHHCEPAFSLYAATPAISSAGPCPNKPRNRAVTMAWYRIGGCSIKRQLSWQISNSTG